MLAACAPTANLTHLTVDVTHLKESASKPGNCAVKIFARETDISRPYDVVCQIDATKSGTGWSRTGADAIDDARPAPCQRSADAAVIVYLGNTGGPVTSRSKGRATFQAFRFTEAK